MTTPLPDRDEEMTARAVAHYRQTTDFTCGPSSLLMAMKAQDRSITFDRTEELQIWREANTVFMGSALAHAGCSALGLALAAHRRGFHVEVRVNHNQPLLGRSGRNPDLKEVNRLMHLADLSQVMALGIPVSNDVPQPEDLAPLLAAGFLPLVLASTWHSDRSRAPHWIVVTGITEDTVLINDPWVNSEQGEEAKDRTDVALPFAKFRSISRYGASRERAMVLVGQRRRISSPPVNTRL